MMYAAGVTVLKNTFQVLQKLPPRVQRGQLAHVEKRLCERRHIGRGGQAVRENAVTESSR